MLITQRTNLYHRFDQLFRHHDVAEPQRRKEDLAHRARVDDTAAIIEPLQTRQRRSIKTELGVVIILQDEGVMLAREVDPGAPPRQAHRHSKRELIRWRDKNNLRRRPSRRAFDYDSLPVD